MRAGTTRTKASMYWMSEPSKLVRKSMERGAARSRGVWRSEGQRSISAQRAKWMKESARRGAVTRLVSLATTHVNRTQIAHHHGTGLRMVSGVARIGVERSAHMPRRDDLARVESWQWGMQSASAR